MHLFLPTPSSSFLLFSIWISIPGGSVLLLFLLLCSPNLSIAASIFNLYYCPLSFSTVLCSCLLSKICTAARFSQPWLDTLLLCLEFSCMLPLLPSCNSLCSDLCLVHLLSPPLVPMENKLPLSLGVCGHNRRQKTPSRDHFLLNCSAQVLPPAVLSENDSACPV